MRVHAEAAPAFRAARRLCAILAVFSIAALAGCVTKQAAPIPVVPVPPPPPVAPHQLSAEQPDFLRLPNMAKDRTPLRVGVILPLSNSSASTRALANALLKAAELALYDSGNRDIVLMTADDSANPAEAGAAAGKLLGQGAEIIIGPLFAASVSAVAPLARDRGVPVLAFSTDRTVGGDGVYLLSFQPQNEVKRVIAYAIAQNHKNFAALIPNTTYGQVSEQAFREAVTADGGTVSAVEHFNPSAGAVMDQTAAISKANADAIFIAQGGVMLRSIAPTLAYSGVDTAKVKLLGTGLWDDPSITKEPALSGGWFAAPAPDANDTFATKYRETFGGTPPQLAALAYDAVSLIALLAPGQPYHRFTAAALTDPNGFAGVDGIFRFNVDGSVDRGLAVLGVHPGGFTVIDPAPPTFQAHGS
jgi:ABC-type branched-subunit amino acid transport system substrate-binding protein